MIGLQAMQEKKALISRFYTSMYVYIFYFSSEMIAFKNQLRKGGIKFSVTQMFV